MRYFAIAALTVACTPLAFGQPASPPGTNAPTLPGSVAPATTQPGTVTPRSTLPTPGTPGTATPGTTTPGLTTPGATTPGTTTPGTVTPGVPARSAQPAVGAQPGTPGLPGTTAQPVRGSATSPTAPRQTDTARRPDARDDSERNREQLQAYFASCFKAKAEKHSELAKMMADKAKHEKVKEFAQTLRKEADEAANKLSQFRQDDKNAAMEQLVSISKKTADNCLQMAREELKDKDGYQRDMAYIGSQIVGLNATVAELKAIKESGVGNREFQDWITEAHERAQQHADEAVSVAKELKKELKDEIKDES